jgi:hypothetical protein
LTGGTPVKAWLDELAWQFLPKSLFGEAVRYRSGQ